MGLPEDRGQGGGVRKAELFQELQPQILQQVRVGLEELEVLADGREDLIVLGLLVRILSDLQRVLGRLLLSVHAHHLGRLLCLVGGRLGLLEDHLD